MKLKFFSIMCLFVLLFPIMPTYFTVAGVGAYRLVAAGLILAFLFFFKRKLTFRFDRFDVFFLLWIVTQMLVDVIYGNVQAAVLLFILTLVPKYIFDSVVNTEERFIKVIDILIYGGLFIAFVSLLEAFTPLKFFQIFNNANVELTDQYRLGIVRVKGFTYQAITYGNYLIMVGTLCFYRITMLPKGRKYYVFICAYVLIAANVFCTGARSSIILFFLSQMWLLYKRGFKKGVFWSVALLAAVLIGFGIINALGIESNVFANAIYLVLAIFSTSAQGALGAGMYDSSSYSGVGDRFALYQWVAEKMDGAQWLIGKGSNAVFKHMLSGMRDSYYWYSYKTSIEVEYLNTLFHYGILGLIGEVLFFVDTIRLTFTRQLKKLVPEKELTFNMIVRVMLITYYVSFFAVMQDTESRMFYIIIYLLVCYNRIVKEKPLEGLNG